MAHSWTKETDGNGVTVRVVLFYYKKAFDLIDHRILVEKLCKLKLPTKIINWVIDFLTVFRKSNSPRAATLSGPQSPPGSLRELNYKRLSR